MLDIQAPPSLNDHVFVDLYLTIGPRAPQPIFRGLKAPNETGNGQIKSDLSDVPDYLLEEVRSLGMAILQRWVETADREPAVEYLGRRYRCALIGQPDLKPAGKLSEEMSRTTHWCVRLPSGINRALDSLGLKDDLMREFRAMMYDRGLLIVAGPTASGKTTTATSLMDYWVRNSRETGVTLEDPPEIPLERFSATEGTIHQIDMSGKSWTEALRYSKRWSPRYLFLGELRTPEATAELLQAAISGPMTLCTIHAGNCVQAVASICRFAEQSMGETAARQLVASCLNGVIHQEVRNGRIFHSYFKIAGMDNFGLRSKIEAGVFERLHEDFDNQVKRREKNRLKMTEMTR